MLDWRWPAFSSQCGIWEPCSRSTVGDHRDRLTIVNVGEDLNLLPPAGCLLLLISLRRRPSWADAITTFLQAWCGGGTGLLRPPRPGRNPLDEFRVGSGSNLPISMPDHGPLMVGLGTVLLFQLWLSRQSPLPRENGSGLVVSLQSAYCKRVLRALGRNSLEGYGAISLVKRGDSP